MLLLVPAPGSKIEGQSHSMSAAEKIVSAAGIAVLAALLALVFNAYLAPGMLINFASLVLCS